MGKNILPVSAPAGASNGIRAGMDVGGDRGLRALSIALLAGTLLPGTAALSPAFAQANVCAFDDNGDAGDDTFRSCIVAANGDDAIDTAFSLLGTDTVVTLLTPVEITTDLTIDGDHPFELHADGPALVLSSGRTLTITDMVTISLADGLLVGDAIELQGTGNTLIMDGRVETLGGLSYAVLAEDGDSGIVISGEIATEGFGAHGVYADGGDNTISVSGHIETQGYLANGVHARGGDSVIDVSGTIVTRGDGEENAPSAGIRVTESGNSVTVSGRIETYGYSADGIWVDGEDNTVAVSGEISTDDDESDGILVTGTDNQITLSGAIATAGYDAEGIRLEGDGNTVLVTSTGTIRNTGYSGDAIVLDGTTGNTVTMRGLIESSEQYGRGILTYGDGNQAFIEGSIITQGDDADGLEVRTGSGNLVDVSGSISTEGIEAHGVEVQGSANTVKVSGSIATTGLDSLAIYLLGGDNRLELQAGFSITGDVLAEAGGNTFTLGGDDDGTFDVERIGDLADGGEFEGFSLFDKRGASTWILTGDNTDLDWTVSEGTLRVSGTVGNVLVDADGILAGNGTLGHVTLTGGTISPGNSIGAMNVQSITFDADSVYAVDIRTDGTSDRLQVAETATLAGIVQVNTLDPQASYLSGQTYRILDAQSISGMFADATMASAFLTPTLIHGTDFVDLRLIVTSDFVSVAQTPNQQQAAGGLDGLEQSGDALAVFNTLLGLSASEARQAFDLTSGEVHASAAHLVEATHDVFTRTLRNRSTPEADLAVETLSSIWMLPMGSVGKVAGDGNAAPLNWWTGGLAGGADVQVASGTGTVLAGAAFGYLASGGLIEERLSQVAGSGYHAALYGAYDGGPVSAKAALSYGLTHLDISRDIVFGTIDRTAVSSYWRQGLGLSSELAYAFTLAEEAESHTTLSPLATLDAHWSAHDGATETGAGALDLTVEEAAWRRVDIGLGLRVAHTAELGAGETVTFEASAAYERSFGDPPVQPMSMAGTPQRFEIAGAAPGPERVTFGTGVVYKGANGLRVQMRYDGTVDIGGGGGAHSGSVGLAASF